MIHLQNLISAVYEYDGHEGPNLLMLDDANSLLEAKLSIKSVKLKIVLLRGHFLKKFRRCPLFAL